LLIKIKENFLKLVKIDIENNNMINLNRFKKLIEINISGSRCGVDDPGICELENLLIINAESNQQITNLKRFKKLILMNLLIFKGLENNGTFYQYINNDLAQKYFEL
jgi:hypothetical protein